MTTISPARSILRNAAYTVRNSYQHAAYTTIWGDGTSSTSPVVQALPPGMSGMAFNMDHTVYGRSFASQDPPPGAYADVPIVTIEF